MSAPVSFGPYELLRKLATGGMAEVWLAKKAGPAGVEQQVVVKRILPQLAQDPEFLQLFLNEARLAARFTHPNITQIFDVGEHDGSTFIAMEYVHGEDLGRVLRAHGKPLPRTLALRLVADAAQGLHYAHTRTDAQGRPLSVVHRDVSPQNVLVSFDGAVKVADFGIARAAGQAAITAQGAVRGKLLYMAPEQAAGTTLDARTDLFALGLVLYELLTGTRPLKRETEAATLGAVLDARIAPPSSVADVPKDLDEVVLRALRKAPGERYQTGRDFQRALEEYLLGTRQLATSAEVAELMARLFPERLRETAAREPLAGQATPLAKGATPATPGTRASPDDTKAVAPPRPSAPPAAVSTPARPAVAAAATPARPAAQIAPPTAVIYRHTVDGLFQQVLARKGLLTHALTERLRALGVDPARPRDVELETWWKVVPVVAEVVAPGLPPEEAYRQVGREVLRGYEASLVGKTAFLVLRMLGVKRSLGKVAESFRASDNATTVEVADTGARSARVRITVLGGLRYPTYTQGVLLEGLVLLGAKDARVTFQPDSVGAVVFDITWA